MYHVHPLDQSQFHRMLSVHRTILNPTEEGTEVGKGCSLSVIGDTSVPSRSLDVPFVTESLDPDRSKQYSIQSGPTSPGLKTEPLNDELEGTGNSRRVK